MTAVQPSCGGTIIYSTGRDFAMLSDAVVLHRTEFWRDASRKTTPPEAAEHRFRSRESKAIEAARVELAAYYSREFRTPAAAAATDAQTAIDAMISSAFNLCE